MSLCIGFGEHKGACGNAPDRELNESGLWCTRCERLRRKHITKQMLQIAALFENAKREPTP